MKKILAILGVITCMVGLCACGQQEKSDLPISEEELLQIGATTVQQIDKIVSQGPNVVEQYVIDPTIYGALVSWQSALEDIGSYMGIDGGEVSVKNDEIIINMNVLGSDHNAVTEIIFDKSMSGYVGITTNVTYTFGELMTKAALNTVIGMGTVFVVLIFISLIISCFGLFSKVGDKKSAESKAAQNAAKADPIVEQIAQKEELAGDAELVAVIAAAIAAYEGSGSTDGFVVRSIRKSNKSKWQNA